MLFVTEPNRLKVLAGKILALTTSIAAAIAATLALTWLRLVCIPAQQPRSVDHGEGVAEVRG
jgi:hypothetical protein